MLNKKPMILVFAGPNGSGKSTITQYFDKVGTYTNADEIVAATGMSNEEAAVFADKKRYEAIEAKEDFTFETVLSSHYKLDILRKAKESGYFIKCIFVLTNDPMIKDVTRIYDQFIITETIYFPFPYLSYSVRILISGRNDLSVLLIQIVEQQKNRHTDAQHIDN